MNVEDVKKKTLEMLGSDNPDDVAFITEEYLAQEWEDEDGGEGIEEENEKGEMVRVIYAHNSSFDGNYYRYHRGTGSRATACSHENRKRAHMSEWDHHNMSARCSHGGGAHRQIFRLRSRS